MFSFTSLPAFQETYFRRYVVIWAQDISLIKIFLCGGVSSRTARLSPRRPGFRSYTLHHYFLLQDVAVQWQWTSVIGDVPFSGCTSVHVGGGGPAPPPNWQKFEFRAAVIFQWWDSPEISYLLYEKLPWYLGNATQQIWSPPRVILIMFSVICHLLFIRCIFWFRIMLNIILLLRHFLLTFSSLSVLNFTLMSKDMIKTLWTVSLLLVLSDATAEWNR